MLNHSAMLVLVLMVFLAVLRQGKVETFDVRTTKLGPCLYRIYIPETTVLASVGPDGTLIVDALVEETGPTIQAELVKLGSKKVDYIVNTHWHFDHTDGNKYLGKHAIVVAHERVRMYLSADQTVRNKSYEAYPPHAIPQITVTDTTVFYFNGETIKVIPLTGGHTDDDVIVYFEKARVLHVGDLCFADMIPFIDIEHGGDILQLVHNLEIISKTMPEDTRVFCGHGREYTIADLKHYRATLLDCIDIVKSEIDKGKRLEEIQRADALKKYKSWERAFTTKELIGFVYHSLKK